MAVEIVIKALIFILLHLFWRFGLKYTTFGYTLSNCMEYLKTQEREI